MNGVSLPTVKCTIEAQLHGTGCIGETWHWEPITTYLSLDTDVGQYMIGARSSVLTNQALQELRSHSCMCRTSKEFLKNPNYSVFLARPSMVKSQVCTYIKPEISFNLPFHEHSPAGEKHSSKTVDPSGIGMIQGKVLEWLHNYLTWTSLSICSANWTGLKKVSTANLGNLYSYLQKSRPA